MAVTPTAQDLKYNRFTKHVTIDERILKYFLTGKNSVPEVNVWFTVKGISFAPNRKEKLADSMFAFDNITNIYMDASC